MPANSTQKNNVKLINISDGSYGLSDRVGGSNKADFFQFELKSRSSLNLSLGGLKKKASAQVFSSKGQIMASSSTTGRSESLGASLEAGIYKIKISCRKSKNSTPYQLKITASPITQHPVGTMLQGGQSTLGTSPLGGIINKPEPEIIDIEPQPISPLPPVVDIPPTIPTIPQPSATGEGVFNGRLFQSVRGTNNLIYNRSSADGMNWNPWQEHGGIAISAPDLEVFNGKLHQSVRGENNLLQTRSSLNGETWSAWVSDGTSTASAPELETFNGKLYQSIRSTNDLILIRSSTDGVNWLAWQDDGGATLSATDLESFNGKLYQSARGVDNRILSRSTSDGLSWSPWREVGGGTLGTPNLEVFNDKLYQSVQGTDNKIYISTTTNGETWTPWQATMGSAVGNIQTSVLNNQIYQMAYRADTSVQLRSSSDGVTWTDWIAQPGSALGDGDWFDAKIRDVGIRSTARSLFSDGTLNRNEMMTIFQDSQDGNTVDATEFTDLKNLVGDSFITMPEYVHNLSNKVVNGDLANRQYKGTSLGNLYGGSSASHLNKLVDKWFLGGDRPISIDPNDSSTIYEYRFASGSLFKNGVDYKDIKQGRLGDCYLLASLAAISVQHSTTIRDMFIDNGDSTYTIRFFKGDGQKDYLTVDRYLPTDSLGTLTYSGIGKVPDGSSIGLWASLAEKAYAQLNESGWLGRGEGSNGVNTYAGIGGGWGPEIYRVFVGGSDSFSTINPGEIATAFNSGKAVALGGFGHVWAMVGYNAVSQKFVLFNPWNSDHLPANPHKEFELTATELTQFGFVGWSASK